MTNDSHVRATSRPGDDDAREHDVDARHGLPTTPAAVATAPDAGRAAGPQRRPLTWRAELGRQLKRRRTLWSFALVLALPLIIVAAFAIGGGGPPSRSASVTLVDLATAGSANFTIFTISASASFLLVILAALFVGDSLPSEASWASLRYLLLAPVPRARLLTSKLVVALATMTVAIVLLVAWSLLVGGVFYGWVSFTNPAGGSLPWSTFLVRLLEVTGFLVVTLTQVGAIAFALGTRTDAPLGAVGGAVLVTIVSAILTQIDNLGVLRYGFPLYYQRAWYDVLTPVPDYANLVHGLLWAVFWSILFIGLGYEIFRRKDVLS